jgi:hypothetical protein
MREPEREGGCGFPQEDDGTLLGFIILDGQVHGPGAAVDGDIEIALASFAGSMIPAIATSRVP